MRPKILFVGDLSSDGRGAQRYRTLQELGYPVKGLSYVPIEENDLGGRNTGLIYRIFGKLGIPISKTRINNLILAEVCRNPPDVLWIEKGNEVFPWTLSRVRTEIPNCRIVSHSEDDMYLWHNRSWYYTLGLRRYDLVFTTKVHNCKSSEFPALGAKQVVFVYQAYDKYLHRSVELTTEEKARYGADVGFVGSYEYERARSLLYLAESGLMVRVWGERWNRFPKRHPNLIIERHGIYGEDYVKALCAARINLCFLRKMNRDRHTSRTFEIPACGAFMLAERTDEHLSLFEDGKEAVFFDSDSELLEKARYYFAHEDERERIARAGRERCFASGYSFHDRLSWMLKQVIAH
jgi:spore maturation protein CgeB